MFDPEKRLEFVKILKLRKETARPGNGFVFQTLWKSKRDEQYFVCSSSKFHVRSHQESHTVDETMIFNSDSEGNWSDSVADFHKISATDSLSKHKLFVSSFLAKKEGQ